jgi:hypothetical protein
MTCCPDRSLDIVVRLIYIHDNCPSRNHASIYLEAAKEIEKLREELKKQ